MKLSVVIPVYNGFHLLKSLLLKLPDHLESKDEIIVVNDGSQDETPETYRTLEDLSHLTKVIEQPHGGIVSALNNGVAQSQNQLIARLDIDDDYDSRRFNEQRLLFHNQPDLVLVFTDYTITSINQTFLGYIPSAVTDYGVKLSLISANRTAHPSAMFRKEAFLRAQGYLQDDFPAEDLGLWIRMISQGKFASIPFPFLKYSMTPGGITSKMHEQMNLKKATLMRSLYSQLNLEWSELQHSLSTYSRCSHASERVVLIFKDYIKLMILKRKLNFTLIRILFRLFINPFYLLATLKLAIFQAKRRLYRTSKLYQS